jgi:PAP2 superfamily
VPRGCGASHRLPPWWIEALVGAAGYAAYQLIQILVSGSARSAVGRAEWLWSAEEHLHLDPEVWLNRLLAGEHVLVIAAGLYYGILHFAVTPAVLVWLRMRRTDVYAPLRNTLVGASLVALLVYWLLPLAPPRLSVPGIVDTLKVNDIMSAGSPSWPASMANQYAAMPSLHVAWAVWVALAVVVVFREWRGRHLAWAYPLSTTLVVMATGNHFLADAVAGALLVAATWVLVRTWAPPEQALSRPDGEAVGRPGGGHVPSAVPTVLGRDRAAEGPRGGGRLEHP